MRRMKMLVFVLCSLVGLAVGAVNFIVINESHTWNEAAVLCHKMGASMLLLHEKSKLTDLRGLEAVMQNFSDRYIWIGLYHHNGKFTWNSCSGEDHEYNWLNWDMAFGEPSVFWSSQHCVSLSKVTKLWYSTECSQKYPVICEQEVPDDPSGGYFVTDNSSTISDWKYTQSVVTQDMTKESCLDACRRISRSKQRCMAVVMNQQSCILNYAYSVDDLEPYVIFDAARTTYYRLDITITEYEESPVYVASLKDSLPVYICSEISTAASTDGTSVETQESSTDGTSVETQESSTDGTSVETQESSRTITSAATAMITAITTTSNSADATTMSTTITTDITTTSNSADATATTIMTTTIATAKITTTNADSTTTIPTNMVVTVNNYATSADVNTTTVKLSTTQDIQNIEAKYIGGAISTNHVMLNGKKISGPKALTPCRCIKTKSRGNYCNISTLDLRLQEDLIVKKISPMSAQRRKKCATDNRMSSQSLGCAGLILIISVFAFVFWMDLSRFYAKCCAKKMSHIVQPIMKLRKF